MTAHNIARLLQSDEALANINKYELDKLIQSFPYWQVAYALRAKYNEIHKLEDETFLNTAAIFAQNRGELKKYVTGYAEPDISNDVETITPIIQNEISIPEQDKVSAEVNFKQEIRIENADLDTISLVEKKETETDEIDIADEPLEPYVSLIDDITTTELINKEDEGIITESETREELAHELSDLDNIDLPQLSQNTENDDFVISEEIKEMAISDTQNEEVSYNSADMELTLPKQEKQTEQAYDNILPSIEHIKKQETISEIDAEIASLKYEHEFQNQAIETKINKEMTFTQWLKFLSEKNAIETIEEVNQNLKTLQSKTNLYDDEFDEEDLALQEMIKPIAQKSAEPTEVVSENYAKILILQGRYEKAREIYQKLSLLNPEKSAYFASEIEKLN